MNSSKLRISWENKTDRGLIPDRGTWPLPTKQTEDRLVLVVLSSPSSVSYIPGAKVLSLRFDCLLKYNHYWFTILKITPHNRHTMVCIAHWFATLTFGIFCWMISWVGPELLKVIRIWLCIAHHESFWWVVVYKLHLKQGLTYNWFSFLVNF